MKLVRLYYQISVLCGSVSDEHESSSLNWEECKPHASLSLDGTHLRFAWVKSCNGRRRPKVAGDDGVAVLPLAMLGCC